MGGEERELKNRIGENMASGIAMMASLISQARLSKKCRISPIVGLPINCLAQPQPHPDYFQTSPVITWGWHKQSQQYGVLPLQTGRDSGTRPMLEPEQSSTMGLDLEWLTGGIEKKKTFSLLRIEMPPGSPESNSRLMHAVIARHLPATPRSVLGPWPAP